MLGKTEGSRRGRERMRWLDGITDGHEFEQAPGAGDGQGGLARCSSCGRKASDMTEQVENIYIAVNVFQLTLPQIGAVLFY